VRLAAAPASAGGGSSGSSCDLPLGDVDDDDLYGALVILVDGTVSMRLISDISMGGADAGVL
jgi:hypothetical protein